MLGYRVNKPTTVGKLQLYADPCARGFSKQVNGTEVNLRALKLIRHLRAPVRVQVVEMLPKPLDSHFIMTL